MIPLIQPAWPVPDNVFAYTSCRNGGLSSGNYASLNTGAHVGDDLQLVAGNRALLPGHASIVWLDQVHGEHCVTFGADVTGPLPASPLQADACISRTPARTCAIMTADRVPVLLCNLAGTEVAAIHAGWQGLEKEIIGHTVSAMKSSADNLMAWIGPAISQPCYEVPRSLAGRFARYPEAIGKIDGSDKCLLDLPLIALKQLNDAGIKNVTQSGLCTYSDPRQFYSHRRATHEGRGQTGRIVSVIGLR